MLQKKEYKFWFCTGSQDLYGDACLAKVAEHSRKIVVTCPVSYLMKWYGSRPLLPTH